MNIPNVLEAALSTFGMPVLASINTGVADPLFDPDYPVIYLPVPAGQVNRFQESDGADPSHSNDSDSTPNGGAMRRLMSIMRNIGLISTWHIFEDPNAPSGFGIHIQLTREGIRFWRRWLDTNDPNYKVQASKDNLHRFW